MSVLWVRIIANGSAVGCSKTSMNIAYLVVVPGKRMGVDSIHQVFTYQALIEKEFGLH